MSVQGARIWLVTRGSGRMLHYQDGLVRALQEAGAEWVDVLDFSDLFRSAAIDLGSRASEWLEGTAGRIIKSLNIRRLFGRDADKQAQEGPTKDETSLEHAPDLIIVDDPTLFRPLRLIPAFRQQMALIVALIDDFRVDTRWRNSPAHAYIVPHETFRAVHLTSGEQVPVCIAGPPVDTTYTSPLTLVEARTRLGLELGAPVLIVAAEGFHSDTLEKVVFQLTLFDLSPTVLFDYGSNDQHAQLLRVAAANYGLDAKMFSDAKDRSTYYASADIVLAGADDSAVLDLLLSYRPLLVAGPERGAARTPFLSDQHAVVWCEDVLELSTRLEKILPPKPPPPVLDHVKALVDPEGTQRVVEALGQLYAQRQTLLSEPEDEPEAQPLTGPPPQAGPLPDQRGTALMKRHTPFESIGGPSTPDKTVQVLPPITTAEAKDQMAALILKEREIERALTQAVRDRDKWQNRLEMAREYRDEDLVAAAGDRLSSAQVQVTRLSAQLETIRSSKDKLKRRVSAPSATPISEAGPTKATGSKETSDISNIENRFRKMEVERDLARLRRKLREEGE